MVKIGVLQQTQLFLANGLSFTVPSRISLNSSLRDVREAGGPTECPSAL